MRLQKLIAASGRCSRRAAEELILAGRVCVNGAAASLGQSADPERDVVTVDGEAVVIPAEKCYIMLNKPRGYVCTRSDERGRPTVMELVRGCGASVFPVGRLDIDSEGLLLLTNDGEWMQRVLHPKYEIRKTYHVVVTGAAEGAEKRLSAITDLDGEPIRPAQVRLLSGGETATLRITIHEGKNRQIRRMCAKAGLKVWRLRRVEEHTLRLGSLPGGKWRYLSADEVRAFQ